MTATPSAPSVLRARALERDFRVSRGFLKPTATLRALAGIDLDVHRGEVLGVVGESGCGKSTLARILLGLLPPTSGEVTLDDMPIAHVDRRSLSRRIQIVFQDPFGSLNPRRSVRSIIEQPLVIHGEGDAEAREAAVRAMLARVGLPERVLDNPPHQLSGGQRQRVAIARALVIHPELVICDEPTSALDVSVQSQILNLLAELRAELGLSYLFISHNLAVVQHLADRVVVMYLGRVVEEGDAAALFEAPRHPYTRALLDSALTPEPGAGIPDTHLGNQFPNPISPPPGCVFHPRCPHAQPLCRTDEPRLQGDARRVACHFPL